ncbi:NanoRNase/pAp phosphatase [Phycisphaerae bacterium RAS1]|nr:NanoRNase/pAp phosphatase [Phycisphaerae bacterium RAS1]
MLYNPPMLTATQFQDAAAWLTETRRPLLVSHQRPDGDALGALAALSLVLRQRGVTPYVALFDALPVKYEFLRDAAVWCVWEDSREVLMSDSDAVIVVDTCSLAQVEPMMKWLASAPATLVIDHHATRDALGTRPGDFRLFDESAGAICLVLLEWFESMGATIDPLMAGALLTGIGTDCGWFRFSNTDARMLRASARLVEAGASVNELHARLYQQDQPPKLRLISRMLASMELHAGGRLAVMALRPDDFVAAGADRSMTEDLVNEATRLRDTEATLLFTQEAGDLIRVNFRSKRELDVAALASRYGGGGHARAAGARLNGTWEAVVPRVVAEAVEAMGPG